ncbi:MAG: flagellin lysine-N-methylase [Lachnospiraceae bacterium]|nr:flagellin lysine-N-methylase [Lachnospiraceae bacterium]
MKTVTTSLQENFKCIADKCPKTCCSGWQIVIDDKSYEKYDTYEGPIKDDLENLVDWDEGCFTQRDNKDCAFLNPSGLCDMITNGGEDMLCDTCRLYPRHVEEYEGVREWSVSLSCPEIARMVVEGKEDIEFSVIEDDEPEPLEDDYEDFDFFFYTNLEETREYILKIANNEDYDIYLKLGLINQMAGRLQMCYDDDETFRMVDCAKEFMDEINNSSDLSKYAIKPSQIIDMDFAIMDELERLDDSFDDILSCVDYYKDEKIDKFLSDLKDIDYEKVLSKVLVSLLYTYYLGAVYNGMVYGYTAMCIFATAMVDILSKGMYERMFENKSGDVTCDDSDLSHLEPFSDGNSISSAKQALIKVLYSYSRETEHSDDNINVLLQYFDSKCE